MTLTLQLTPEQESREGARALRSGMSLTDFVIQRLPGDREPTGAQVGDGLRTSGVLGTLADMPDSPEWPRQFRRRARTR